MKCKADGLRKGAKMKESRKTVWVCAYCGKVADDRYDFDDESCMLNSVECYEDSLKYENGRVVAALPVEKKDGEKD